jgi:hypothetical protein
VEQIRPYRLPYVHKFKSLLEKWQEFDCAALISGDVSKAEIYSAVRPFSSSLDPDHATLLNTYQVSIFDRDLFAGIGL